MKPRDEERESCKLTINKVGDSSSKKNLTPSLIFLSIMLQFGNNYAFDIPQALESEIENRLDITQVEFNLLYSVFALPNIGLSIGGGMMIDRVGGRWGVFTFSFLMWLSQLAIALGGAYQKYYMMLVGRAIFGIASDMLFISISKVLVQRVGQSSGFAMGLVLTVPELATALNSFLSPYLFQESQSLTLPLVFGLTVCILSFLCGLYLIKIDSMYEDEPQQDHLITQEKNIQKIPFTGPFVTLMVICTLTLAVYVPFLDNVSKFYEERFGWSEKKAGRVVMIGYIVAACSSPFIGNLSDNLQHKRKTLIVISTSLFLASHLQFFLLKQGTQQLPNELSILGLVTLGLGYACYSSILLPSLQDTIPDGYFGNFISRLILRSASALGILGVGENICLASVPILSGIIYGEWNKKGRMRAVDGIYVTMATIAFLFSIKLYISKEQIKQKQK